MSSNSSNILDLRKIARSQGKLARDGSGLAEGEVPVGTSREDRPLPAEVIWPGDGGALRRSSILDLTFMGVTYLRRRRFHTPSITPKAPALG